MLNLISNTSWDSAHYESLIPIGNRSDNTPIYESLNPSADRLEGDAYYEQPVMPVGNRSDNALIYESLDPEDDTYYEPVMPIGNRSDNAPIYESLDPEDDTDYEIVAPMMNTPKSDSHCKPTSPLKNWFAILKIEKVKRQLQPPKFFSLKIQRNAPSLETRLHIQKDPVIKRTKKTFSTLRKNLFGEIKAKGYQDALKNECIVDQQRARPQYEPTSSRKEVFEKTKVKKSRNVSQISQLLLSKIRKVTASLPKGQGFSTPQGAPSSPKATIL